jgi:predicted nucleic acid-binding protein
VSFVALLDANVLYPAWLRDALLRVAETEVFQVRWSERILDEACHNIKADRPDLDPAAIDRTFEDMRRSFDDAMVVGYESLEPAMENAAEDRHVLAAAIVGRADVIVTENLYDFPRSALEPYGLDVQHPDVFLCNQWELDEESMVEAIRLWLEDLSRPPLTLDQLLQKLELHAPQFCQMVRQSALGQQG